MLLPNSPPSFWQEQRRHRGVLARGGASRHCSLTHSGPFEKGSLLAFWWKGSLSLSLSLALSPSIGLCQNWRVPGVVSSIKSPTVNETKPNSQWYHNIPTGRLGRPIYGCKISFLIRKSQIKCNQFENWSICIPLSLLANFSENQIMMFGNPSYNFRRRSRERRACIAARRSMKYIANKTHLVTVANVMVTNL